MSDTNPAPEMWGMSEICTFLDLSRARVYQFRQRTEGFTFPPPHQTLECGPIWVADDIRDWKSAREVAAQVIKSQKAS